MSVEMFTMMEPISKTLPVGLCHNFATDGKGHAVCLQSHLKEEVCLERCLCGRNCECYNPAWYGFDGQNGR